MADERLFETEDAAGQTGVPVADAPLATRMRPPDLDEFIGQGELLEPGSALRVAIESGEPHSAIFYGPPGTGKTTLARIIAARARGAFEELSAVNAGRPEVRQVIERAERRRVSGRPTIFFLDEIHRFNKAQQDALLPAVEEGLLTLIGATTENPYFEVNSALLSRTQIYEFRQLDAADIEALLRRALSAGRGLPDAPPVGDEALEMLATRAGGDARVALAALERAVETTVAAGEGEVRVEAVEDALQRKALLYDRAGDKHYDYISAWIKATRGSDVDASIYYLAVMLEGGEDPRFIARRMVIFASEDVGNADPQALVVATAAGQAVDRVGLPECALNLAQASAYLALAPKSNASTRAIARATSHVREHGAAEPPPYLQDAHYPGAKQLGRGSGYRYPHDEPDGVSDQPLAPGTVRGERFYEPVERGFERQLRERLEWLRSRLGIGL
ncbi:MAG TPA: replication-associated recombination protein A [Solirubrobacterales bacterium]|jgi:putative ATPase|nr:replication-associated recombination protein A [Solirubrobacterales bacterium]